MNTPTNETIAAANAAVPSFTVEQLMNELRRLSITNAAATNVCGLAIENGSLRVTTAAPVVTEADVISFMQAAQAALNANQDLNRGFVEPVRLSVYAGAEPHFSISGHFGTDWSTSRHVFASGNTIAQTIAAVFKDVGTPDTRAAAMREQAAKLLAEADKLTAAEAA